MAPRGRRIPPKPHLVSMNKTASVGVQTVRRSLYDQRVRIPELRQKYEMLGRELNDKMDFVNQSIAILENKKAELENAKAMMEKKKNKREEREARKKQKRALKEELGILPIPTKPSASSKTQKLLAKKVAKQVAREEQVREQMAKAI